MPRVFFGFSLLRNKLKMTTETVVETKVVMTPAERLTAANKVVRNYSVGSIAPAVVPVPILDLVLLTGLQLKMLHSLSGVYGVPFSKDLGKKAISSLVGGVAPLAMEPVVASVVKIIPFLGQAAGAISLGTLGGATTYAIGKVFTQHFESGGTFLSFDPQKVRDYYASALEEGKQVVGEAQSTKNHRASGAVAA
jgi:uncharacterized protein (DUF697 family)